MSTLTILPIFGILIFTALTPCIHGQLSRLQPMNVNKDWITLSGFSSGGTFAQQLQISYSSLFSGIGVFSHGYYRCGPGDGVVTNFDNVCTTIGGFPVERLWNPKRALKDIEQYYRQGLIENPNNLRNKRLYVYSGTQNVFFTLDMSLRIMNVYEPLIGSQETIKSRVQNANYTMPTNKFGGSCTADSSADSYISNCGFSGAFEALNWLLGSDAISKNPEPNQYIAFQPLQEFDQTEFFYGYEGPHNMDTTGFLYVPKNCINNPNKCFVHFFFHGCFTGREFFGDSHIRSSGFLEVAELNSVIMVFPQAMSSLPQNQIGCWDTYGIAGPLYATQKGPQVRIVRNMISRILGEDHGKSGHHRQAPYQSQRAHQPLTPHYMSHAHQNRVPEDEEVSVLYENSNPLSYFSSNNRISGFPKY